MSFFNLLLVTLERCLVPPLSELRVPQYLNKEYHHYMSEVYDLLTVLTQVE